MSQITELSMNEVGLVAGGCCPPPPAPKPTPTPTKVCVNFTTIIANFFAAIFGVRRYC